MSQHSKSTLSSFAHVTPFDIERYLSRKGWDRRRSKREGVAIFFRESPNPTEIVLALSDDYADRDELVVTAISKLSRIENRPIDQLINDLLLPPSDVIRFRVENEQTRLGLISFREGFALLENARKSLFTTACDLISPSFYHKRMSYKSAQKFIDSCLLGQTERGSFVASIVCPITYETDTQSTSQLSLFDFQNLHSLSFTRTVTSRYMKTLYKLKNAIESRNYDPIVNPASADIISANFIESIIELSDYENEDTIEILASWSQDRDLVDGIPSSVSFNKVHIPTMEYLINELKPKEEEKKGVFHGKISHAGAEPDPSNRTQGEVTFNFIDDNGKAVRAKVFLNTDDFSKALDALDNGSNVQIIGLLVSRGRTKYIEEPEFKIL